MKSLPLADSTPMGYMCFMQTVAETPTFTRQADNLFDEDEKQELITFLSLNPLAGDVIAGTGGVRKVRLVLAGLQSAHERFERHVRLLRRFLLHPVPYPRDDSGAAEISAGDGGVGVKVDSRNKCAYRVALASDEARWLHNIPST